MLNFALLALILLAMIIPVAIIGALSLALKGVSSLDLSIGDFYIVIAPTHTLAVLVIAEVAVVAAASKNPDQPIIRKMVCIARHLKGKVQGEEGEVYDGSEEGFTQ